MNVAIEQGVEQFCTLYHAEHAELQRATQLSPLWLTEFYKRLLGCSPLQLSRPQHRNFCNFIQQYITEHSPPPPPPSSQFSFVIQISFEPQSWRLPHAYALLLLTRALFHSRLLLSRTADLPSVLFDSLLPSEPLLNLFFASVLTEANNHSLTEDIELLYHQSKLARTHYFNFVALSNKLFPEQPYTTPPITDDDDDDDEPPGFFFRLAERRSWSSSDNRQLSQEELQLTATIANQLILLVHRHTLYVTDSPLYNLRVLLQLCRAYAGFTFDHRTLMRPPTQQLLASASGEFLAEFERIVTDFRAFVRGRGNPAWQQLYSEQAKLSEHAYHRLAELPSTAYWEPVVVFPQPAPLLLRELDANGLPSVSTAVRSFLAAKVRFDYFAYRLPPSVTRLSVEYTMHRLRRSYAAAFPRLADDCLVVTGLERVFIITQPHSMTVMRSLLLREQLMLYSKRGFQVSSVLTDVLLRNYVLSTGDTAEAQDTVRRAALFTLATALALFSGGRVAANAVASPEHTRRFAAYRFLPLLCEELSALPNLSEQRRALRLFLSQSVTLPSGTLRGILELARERGATALPDFRFKTTELPNYPRKPSPEQFAELCELVFNPELGLNAATFLLQCSSPSAKNKDRLSELRLSASLRQAKFQDNPRAHIAFLPREDYCSYVREAFDCANEYRSQIEYAYRKLLLNHAFRSASESRLTGWERLGELCFRLEWDMLQNAASKESSELVELVAETAASHCYTFPWLVQQSDTPVLELQHPPPLSSSSGAGVCFENMFALLRPSEAHSCELSLSAPGVIELSLERLDGRSWSELCGGGESAAAVVGYTEFLRSFSKKRRYSDISN
jgi:hypothetical protein